MGLLADHLESHIHSYHDSRVVGEVRRIGVAVGQVEEHIAEEQQIEWTQKPGIEAAVRIETVVRTWAPKSDVGMTCESGVEMTAGCYPVDYSHSCLAHLQEVGYLSDPKTACPQKESWEP